MPKRSAGKRPATKSAPKEVPIPYEHAVDYRHIVSTGSLVRAERNDIVVTHYIDEMMPVSQTARLQSPAGQDPPTYSLGDLEERPRRLVVAAIRLDPEQAASLANLLAEKVHSIRPDLIQISEAETQQAHKTK